VHTFLNKERNNITVVKRGFIGNISLVIDGIGDAKVAQIKVAFPMG